MAKAKRKAKKPAKRVWFVKTRGSYLPKSWQGILLYFIYVSYLLVVLIDAVNMQENWVRTIIFIFPQWVAAILAITYVASKKS